jgi:hypothetical protein
MVRASILTGDEDGSNEWEQPDHDGVAVAHDSKPAVPDGTRYSDYSALPTTESGCGLTHLPAWSDHDNDMVADLRR